MGEPLSASYILLKRLQNFHSRHSVVVALAYYTFWKALYVLESVGLVLRAVHIV